MINDKKREEAQVIYSTGAWIFIITSLVLFLGAIGLFIWMIVNAAEAHVAKYVLFGSSFLLLTVALLLYSIFIYKAPKTATGITWAAVILGIATFIVGLCI